MNGFRLIIQSHTSPSAKDIVSNFYPPSNKVAEYRQFVIPLNLRNRSIGRMVNYLVILSILYMITGCAAINSNVYIPCKNDLIAIEKVNDADANRRGDDIGYAAGGNCKEQAIAYHDTVRRSGDESCVTCGILVQYSQPLKHCWNEVKCPEDGKWKLIDASRNSMEFRDGWDVEQSPEYMPYIRFKGRVSVEDIRKEQNYFWKSDQSLSYLIDNCEFQWIPIISEWQYIF